MSTYKLAIVATFIAVAVAGCDASGQTTSATDTERIINALSEKAKAGEGLGAVCEGLLDHQDVELHSCCGQPGDVGNSLGVGKFCFTDRECKHSDGATLCSSAENGIADHKSYFCTIPCDPANPENICGEGAACGCEEVGCFCLPTACQGENLPEGCEEA